MTDAKRIELMADENKRLQGEVEVLAAKAAQWEAQAEKLTRMKLESDRNAYAAEQSEQRLQKRLDALQRAYNALSDDFIDDFDKILDSITEMAK